MKTIKTFVLIYSLLLLATACKKEENKEFTDSPIIESYLEPGNYFTVKVNRQLPFSSNVNYSPDDINKLQLSVSYDHATHVLIPIDSGKYIDSTTIVKEGTGYDLTFAYNSKNVSAYTYIPSKPQNFTQSVTEISLTKIDGTTKPPFNDIPDPIQLTWKNTDGSNYLILVENMEATLEPIRDFGTNTPPKNRFKKLPVNTGTQELNAREFQYFGKHRIILYHVLADYAALYNQNSTSSQNLTNPSTTIVNGYGIFTGLNSDTLYVNVKKK
jgi:hypothetical protein